MPRPPVGQELVPSALTGWGGMLRDAFAYPCCRQGWIIVLTSTLMGSMAEIFSVQGRDSHDAFGFWLYLCFAVFYVGVIETTVAGGTPPPAFPSPLNFTLNNPPRANKMVDTMLGPVLMMRAAVMSLLPAILYLMVVPGANETDVRMLAFGWLGLGYFSMALLTDVVRDRTIFLLPHHVLPAIARTWPGYLVVTALLAAIVLLINAGLPLAHAHPWTVTPPALVVVLWLVLVHARLLGLFHRTCRAQLGW